MSVRRAETYSSNPQVEDKKGRKKVWGNSKTAEHEFSEDQRSQKEIIERAKKRLELVGSSGSDAGKTSWKSDKSRGGATAIGAQVPCVIYVQTATGAEPAWLRKMGPQCEVTYFRDFSHALVDRRLLREFNQSSSTPSDRLASMVLQGELSFSSIEKLYHKTESSRINGEEDANPSHNQSTEQTDSIVEEVSKSKISVQTYKNSTKSHTYDRSKQSSSVTQVTSPLKPQHQTADSTPLQIDPNKLKRPLARAQLFEEESPLSVNSQSQNIKNRFDWKKLQAEFLEISQGNDSSLKDEEVVEVLGNETAEKLKGIKSSLTGNRETIPSVDSVEQNLSILSEVVNQFKPTESIEDETQCTTRHISATDPIEARADLHVPTDQSQIPQELHQTEVKSKKPKLKLVDEDWAKHKAASKIYQQACSLVDKLDKTVMVYRKGAEDIKISREERQEERNLRRLARHSDSDNTQPESARASKDPAQTDHDSHRLSKLKKSQDGLHKKSERVARDKEDQGIKLGKRDSNSSHRLKSSSRLDRLPQKRVSPERVKAAVAKERLKRRPTKSDDFVIPDAVAQKYSKNPPKPLSFARKAHDKVVLPPLPSLSVPSSGTGAKPISPLFVFAKQTLETLHSRRLPGVPAPLPLITTLAECVCELNSESQVLEILSELIQEELLFNKSGQQPDLDTLIDTAKEKVELVKFSKNVS